MAARVPRFRRTSEMSPPVYERYIVGSVSFMSTMKRSMFSARAVRVASSSVTARLVSRVNFQSARGFA